MVVVVVQTVEGTRVSVQARTCRAVNSNGSHCHQLAESISTPYRATTGPWRATHVVCHLPGEEKVGGAPTSSFGSPNPVRIDIFHRSGVGSFPKCSTRRLAAELLPVILNRFAGRSFTRSLSRK